MLLYVLRRKREIMRVTIEVFERQKQVNANDVDYHNHSTELCPFPQLQISNCDFLVSFLNMDEYPPDYLGKKC